MPGRGPSGSPWSRASYPSCVRPPRRPPVPGLDKRQERRRRDGGCPGDRRHTRQAVHTAAGRGAGGHGRVADRYSDLVRRAALVRSRDDRQRHPDRTGDLLRDGSLRGGQSVQRAVGGPDRPASRVLDHGSGQCNRCRCGSPVLRTYYATDHDRPSPIARARRLSVAGPSTSRRKSRRSGHVKGVGAPRPVRRDAGPRARDRPGGPGTPARQRRRPHQARLPP